MESDIGYRRKMEEVVTCTLFSPNALIHQLEKARLC